MMHEHSNDDEAVRALAARAGLREHWIDAHGHARRVELQTLRALLAAMGWPCQTPGDVRASTEGLDRQHARDASSTWLMGVAGAPLRLSGSLAGHSCLLRSEADPGFARTVQPQAWGDAARLQAPSDPGYYRLETGHQSMRLAITLDRPRAALALRQARQRMWGAMAQVYSLRSTCPDPAAATRGHGDFAAVRRLAEALAGTGADVLALSPVHALFDADPGAFSPYSPSNRLFWNTAFAAAAEVLGASMLREALATLGPTDWAALDRPDRIDWPASHALRTRVMRALHGLFQQCEGPLPDDYRRFVRESGPALQDHATFEALHARHTRQHGSPLAWPSWQAPWRDAHSREVREYRTRHDADIDFHRFLQWLTVRSLDCAHQAARSAGMRIGLLSDLAVGASPIGSQAWSRPEHFLSGVSIGAPPDIHNPGGQSWNLTAFSPQALQQNGFEPFLDVLRAALEHSGGARIDHILGFERLWVIPEGARPEQGVYLQMPAQALLALSALEAWRHRALLIGENLGTVPEGFDARMHAQGILGMNVLWFMRAKAAHDSPAPFLPPSSWPRDAVAMPTTHDLPTLSGWWHATDIRERQDAGLLSASQTEALLAARNTDRRALWHQLRAEDDPAPDPKPDRAASGDAAGPPTRAPLPALLGHVARAPCPLMLVSLEDLAGIERAPNVPCTIEEFPNWRQRLPGDTARCVASPPWQARIAAIQQTRGRA